MPSDELFGPLFVPDAVREAVSGRAWLHAMLAAEGALARAEGRAGVIPAAAAEAIVAACVPARFDPHELGVEGRAAGNPVEPLVRALRAAVAGEAAEFVHHGATSQDVLDTAAALVTRGALAVVRAELEGLADECARLADEHRATVMAARTVLQQAVPTTFGLKAAGWLVGMLDASRALDVTLPVELGGAAGTLAALGQRGLDVRRLLAEELGLPEPTVTWHANRVGVATLGNGLAVAAGVCAKIGLDVALLAQTEVEEVRLPADGRSSTMPHKRNPVGPTFARACALHAHAAAGVLTLAVVGEHERAAGVWHAEWGALSDALAFAGGAAAWVRLTLAELEVDVERMRANLAPETTSEARRFVGHVEPAEYLGAADALIDRALALHRRG